MAEKKQVVCVSWDSSLAASREMLLDNAGYLVVSALGTVDALHKCRQNTNADILVLGHSVPQEEKRKIITVFREHNSVPVLSLLNVNQERLPEVEYAVEALDPGRFLDTVRLIVRGEARLKGTGA